MSMRIFSATSLLLLSACGTAENTPGPTPETAQEKIECAVTGSAAFNATCTVERSETTAASILTVHEPDGGFHRLTMTNDGRGVVAADGSQPATVQIVAPDKVEVTIGTSRYRLPAAVTPTPTP